MSEAKQKPRDVEESQFIDRFRIWTEQGRDLMTEADRLGLEARFDIKLDGGKWGSSWAVRRLLAQGKK